jgi:regulator of protease activity HflC (stomatin/prohibitin superfamily)
MDLSFLVGPSLAVLCAIFAAVILLRKGFQIVRQYERGVVFRFGKYRRLLEPGLRWIIPGIDVATTVDMRMRTIQKQQTSITSDNVPVEVSAVIWFEVESAMDATIKVQGFEGAITNLALTSLRGAIGKVPLDTVLTDQEAVSKGVKESMQEGAQNWGIKVDRVELQDIQIPETMKRVMAQEAEAIREKRARIIKAEAELEAAKKIKEAADVISANPTGLELRRFQMITEVGAEQNTTTIVMIPSQFMDMAKGISDLAARAK